MNTGFPITEGKEREYKLLRLFIDQYKEEPHLLALKISRYFKLDERVKGRILEERHDKKEG